VLKRKSIPFLIFANKIDRLGARYETLIKEVHARLTPNVVPLGSGTNIGEKHADFHLFDQIPPSVGMELIEIFSKNNDKILNHFVENGPSMDSGILRRSLIDQTHHGLVHPMLFGSAITGTGVTPNPIYR
jgi:ribosomal protection tetracycline resistance protein